MVKLKEINHIIIGMDRQESIYNKLTTIDSILIIINSMIRNNNTNKEIHIYYINEEFIIKGYGEELPEVINFEKEVNINKNLLIMSMSYLCEIMYVTITKNDDRKSKELHFGDINNSLFKEILKKPMLGKNLKDSIEFRIRKCDLTLQGKDILNEKYQKQLISKLEELYKKAINRGMKIKVFDKEIKYKGNAGILLNKIENGDNVDIKIELYKMKSDIKGIEVIINGVKIENKNLDEFINWNKKPFKECGYTFKRLFI